LIGDIRAPLFGALVFARDIGILAALGLDQPLDAVEVFDWGIAWHPRARILAPIAFMKYESQTLSKACATAARRKIIQQSAEAVHRAELGRADVS
jgi:hypothetical protein